MKNLLWVDCSAGGVVGVTVLLLSDWLSRVYGLPREIVRLTAAANLIYASSSLLLATRASRPLRLVGALAFANVAWAVVCGSLALFFMRSATRLGLAHLLLEALFVGGLGTLEWRWRSDLAASTDTVDSAC